MSLGCSANIRAILGHYTNLEFLVSTCGNVLSCISDILKDACGILACDERKNNRNCLADESVESIDSCICILCLIINITKELEYKGKSCNFVSACKNKDYCTDEVNNALFVAENIIDKLTGLGANIRKLEDD